MNNVYMSKSKYCRAVQCEKILWLDKYKKEVAIAPDNTAVLETGTEVGILARELFGKYTNIEYNEDLTVMLEATKKALEEKNTVITEASFEFNHNFCSVDILKTTENGVEIYEVKSSTDIHEIYLDDVSYQYYILTSLGYNVEKASIVYLNREYVRNGELELNKLFNIEDVTDIAEVKQEEIKEKLEAINIYLNEHNEENEPEQDIGMYCSNPYDCVYWNYCTRNLPKNNIFKIRRMHKDKKFEYYYEGKASMEDIQYEDINPKYLEQIDFELNAREDKIEKEKIKEFLETLSYPIYFLDFETYQQAIPQYDGIKPYMQIPFQYSLHYIEAEGAELKHKEFLAIAGADPRRKLAERLIADIPINSCVIAYNMGFEKSVIKNLAEIYPDLSEHLLNIRENIKDLMIPFSQRMYYNKAMEGSYSIKYVLPALYPNEKEFDYHNLPVVHNGAEASESFLSLTKLSKEEQEKVRNGLLVYCKLDTYAMVKVWEKLKEIIR